MHDQAQIQRKKALLKPGEGNKMLRNSIVLNYR